jgi:LuxR family maltose regulon positive regulatory protein
LSPTPRSSVSRPGLISRERLVSKLTRAAGGSVALLAAPAGYGKTTVLSQWDAADERRFLWIALSERDNDPSLLLGSIAEALAEFEPIGNGLFEALAAPRPSIFRAVLPRLIEAMAEADAPLVVVLDDIHCIDEPESLKALAALAEQVPSTVCLAVAGHAEPAIGIGRLRAHQRLVEIHAHDLVMTRSEAEEMLRAAGLELGQRAVRRLVERTEGWPAALYLATLAIEGEADPASAIERFAGDDKFVADYLREEFLTRQSPDDADFLTATSVLDRLSGDVCDAVLQREGSAETLRRLSRANLLLVPLDRKDELYRYHSLLREMLASELHRLGARKEATFHARASRWYAAHGDFDHAIPHAIAAGNRAVAGRLIWMKTPDYETSGREATMRRWLARFTDEEIAASPELSLASAANCATRGDGAAVERWTAAAVAASADLPDAERAFAEATARLIKATGAARDGIEEMRRSAELAAEMIPDESPFRSLCCFLAGVGYHLADDAERARGELREAVHRAGARVPNIRTLSLAQLALIELDQDELDAAGELVLEAMAQADLYGLAEYPTSALVFAVSALVRARQGRVEDATRHARHCSRLIEGIADFSTWYVAETHIVVARALLLLDDVPAAQRHLADAARYLDEASDARVLEGWRLEATREAEAIGELGGRWPLTKAELRLLHRLPSHHSFREIGEQLFVSTNTVKTQAQAIYRKLGVSSRAEAVACAKAAGLIPDR